MINISWEENNRVYRNGKKMTECLFISWNNINTTQYRYEYGKAMKYRHATDIVSVMYKYTYLVSYNFLGNGEYMKFNKLASSCIKLKFCRSKPQFDTAVYIWWLFDDISFTDLHLKALRADTVTHRGDRVKVVIFSPNLITW